MNNMSYQNAADIRKKSFISMITEKLIEGNGVGSAIGKTISEKSKARSKGFKEKFDLLNIVKFMTGGSKLGPAIYGSLAGRSKEDIKYFTGASAKPVGASATRIESLETANEMVSLLLKIYDFMRTTNEEEKTRKQKENNFKEELEHERGIRHKALLEALSGLNLNKSTAIKKENDFGGIFAGLIDFVKGLIGAAISGVMAIVEGISSTISALLSAFGGLSNLGIVKNLMRLLVSPVGIALLAGYAAKNFMEFLVNVREQDKISNPKDYENVPSEVAKRTGETSGQVGQRQRRESVKGFRETEISEALNAKPNFTDDELVSMYGRTRKDLQNWVSMNPGGFLKKDTFIPEPTPTSQAEAQDLENGASQQPLPAPAPVVVPPATNKLNEKTKEMNEAKLPTPAPAPVTKTTNTTNVIGDKKLVPTGDLPSVRNVEPTFANMILYSTRVV